MKVSIIIVVYNAELWLDECIKSAINQTMNKQEYEILIIDNGSTDGSKQIINSYACQYDNIKVFFEKENKRVTIMYNKYLKVANGEYIYFIHSDDIMSKDLITVCYDEMNKKGLDLVFFGWKSFYKDGYDIEKNKFIVKDKEKITSIIPANEILSGKEVFKQEQWLGSEFAFLFNRKFLINNNLTFCEKMLFWDLEFPPRVLMKAERVMRIDKILYYYRLRKDYVDTTKDDLINIHIKNTLSELSNLVGKQDKSDKKLMDSFKKYFHNLFNTLEINLLKKIDSKEIQMKLIKEYEDYLKMLMVIFGEEFSLDRILIIFEGINKIFKSNFADKKNFISNLDSYCNFNIKSQLSNIPFNDEAKIIGVYGIGNHTDNLLSLYSLYIDEVKCKIVYFDSFIDDKIINGSKIINIKNINNFDLDCIVLSTLSHEKELYNNVKKFIKKDITIYKFYD